MNVVLANPSGHEYLALLADGREGQSLTHLGDRPVSELLPLWSRRLAVDINLQGRSPRVFEVHANPGKTAKQEGGWTLLIREVTDAREAQRRVELQDRLAAVGQLAAGIAHDFNNITGTILLMSSAMIGAGNLTEKDRERATTVGEQAKRATSLTQQILDFSRRTVMQPQPMDLVSFLKEFEKLMSRTLPENIRMTFPAAMEEFVVSGDPGRLQQVLMNLALNARDAMVEGGELSFELDTIRLKPGERPPYRDMHAGEWVRLRISDSGTGIAPDVLAHVFEPFFTTKEPGHGTGLGLAQVYGIVKQHGGYIDVESRVGEGSTFVIYLPALKEGARAIAPATEAAEEKGKGETILVVEDEPALLEAIVTALEGLGYHLLTAADGREALAVYEEHAKSIDLVVSDLVMPVMGGKELYRTLRENYPDLKMVLMTGYPLGKGTRELLDQQRVTWVQKPLDIAKLSQVVRSQLKR
jgi:signal transduction histidine kinase